ncbi:MAG: outer membrane protein assembly factor BamB family protein [Planctomycetota bacterium]
MPDSAAGYRVLWQSKKAVCDYASPLTHRGHVYYINKVGVLYCLDAATGEQQYAHRFGHPCWAQPIAAGNRVYLFGKDGVTTVIAAGPEFKLLATNRLWHENTPPRPTRSFEYTNRKTTKTRVPVRPPTSTLTRSSTQPSRSTMRSSYDSERICFGSTATAEFDPSTDSS